MPYNIVQSAFPQPAAHIKSDFVIPFHSEFLKTYHTVSEPNRTEVNHSAMIDFATNSVCFLLVF